MSEVAPRPWVTFDGTTLSFAAHGLTLDEIAATNAYIKMIYREALETGPVAGAINLANLELRDAELALHKVSLMSDGIDE